MPLASLQCRPGWFSPGQNYPQGRQRGSLGDIRVASPRDAVPTVHENGSEVILQQIQLNGIDASVPDPGQLRIAARKAARVVGGLIWQTSLMPVICQGWRMDRT